MRQCRAVVCMHVCDEVNGLLCAEQSKGKEQALRTRIKSVFIAITSGLSHSNDLTVRPCSLLPTQSLSSSCSLLLSSMSPHSPCSIPLVPFPFISLWLGPMRSCWKRWTSASPSCQRVSSGTSRPDRWAGPHSQDPLPTVRHALVIRNSPMLLTCVSCTHVYACDESHGGWGGVNKHFHAALTTKLPQL